MNDSRCCQQLRRTLKLLRQNLTDRIKHLDRIPFVHQSSTCEWNTTAVKNDLFELIQLVQLSTECHSWRCGGKPN